MTGKQKCHHSLPAPMQCLQTSLIYLQHQTSLLECTSLGLIKWQEMWGEGGGGGQVTQLRGGEVKSCQNDKITAVVHSKAHKLCVQIYLGEQ